MAEGTIREIVGVFRDAGALRKAADELMIAGFDRSELNLLGSHKTVEEKLGNAMQNSAALEDNPRVPMQAYFGPDSLTEAKAAIVGVPAFVGTCAAVAPAIAHHASLAEIIIWAAIGLVAGLLLGMFSMKRIAEKSSSYLREQVEHGGILLWVRTDTQEKEAKASTIMKRCGAKDVHVHNRPVIKEWGFLYGYLDWLAGDHRPTSQPAVRDGRGGL